MMYHKSGQQQHLRFICTQKLINEFWNNHRVGRIFAFRNYEKAVLTKIQKEFLRVLSIVIYTEWNDLVRFDPVFVMEGLDDDSLFFDERKLRHMETGIHNFIELQYLFRPEIIKQKHQAFIQFIPDIIRLPFIGDSELLARGGYGSVSRKQIAPHCLETISEENVPNTNESVSSASHYNVQY